LRGWHAPVIVLLGQVVLACSDPAAVPTSTGAVCPDNFALTYDNFGRPFMEKYCTRCHAGYLHGADRHGAPLYHDFDSLLDILYVWEHVDQYTAAGPESVNTIMPPDGDKPSMDERVQLGQWLACEVEKLNAPQDAGPVADAGSGDAAQ